MPAPMAPRAAETAEGLAALEAAFAGGGVHLIAVTVDYSEKMRVLVDELCSHQP